MASPTTHPISESSGAPIPLTTIKRRPVQPSSSSSWPSSGLASARSSSTSVSPQETTLNVPAACPTNSTPEGAVNASPELSPAISFNENPFENPQQRPVPSLSGSPPAALNDQSPRSSPARLATWHSWVPTPDSKGSFLQNTIGMAGLAVALVGLLVYAYRGYKMDKYNNLMALYQACASLKQVGTAFRLDMGLTDIQSRLSFPQEVHNAMTFLRRVLHRGPTVNAT